MSNGTILLIDNYDSFAYNLARYLVRLGQRVQVVRNDAVNVASARSMQPTAIVLSPGPGHPQTAGCCVSLVREFSGQLPMLGICLGHQAMVMAFGGDVVRAPIPMHGRASQVHHCQRGVFEKVPTPFRACRYHSLAADPATLPSCLKVTATTDGEVVMAAEHRQHLTVGLQFHPESILTENGYLILENFLRLAGLSLSAGEPFGLDEQTAVPQPDPQVPSTPITY